MGKVNECVGALDEGEGADVWVWVDSALAAGKRQARWRGFQGSQLHQKYHTAPRPLPCRMPHAAERTCRLEMESKTVRQVGTDLLRLQERLDSERAAR